MQCIDPDSIKKQEVSQGRTNNAIHGDTTEFKVLNEKPATFNIRFRALNPKAKKENVNVDLHFDVEPQKNYRPGYPIEKRANIYVARTSISSCIFL